MKIFAAFYYNKSSLIAEADGLPADRADSAFETTTGMRKQSDRLDSEYL